MWNDIEGLHEHRGNVPVEIRFLKLAEAVGEAAEALIVAPGPEQEEGRLPEPRRPAR